MVARCDPGQWLIGELKVPEMKQGVASQKPKGRADHLRLRT